MKLPKNNRFLSNFKFRLPKDLSKKRVFNWFIRGLAIFLALVAFAFIWFAKDLPDPNKLLTRSIPQSTKIFARDGSLLYEVHGEFKRTLIPYSDMNDNVRHATIAIEDRNFYNENGINMRSIFRALYADIAHHGVEQGGSTITQQFVKNAMLSRERTASRKIKEIILALEINKIFSKDDILKLYLNEIPYGRNAYGIEAAAQAYFNKHAKDLDLAEAAYLAALPQAPTFYSPTGPHRADLDRRKNLVLEQMYEQGYITETEKSQAQNEQVNFVKASDSIQAPHFVLYIEDYITQKYGESALQTGGLQITTTLDPRLQGIAEKVVKDDVANNSVKYNAHNAALVAIDPKTGQVLAMVGSKDYFGDPEPKGCKPGVNCTFEPNVNVATSERQPGSSGKPYVYVTAFKPEFKQAPVDLRWDLLTNFGTFGGKPYEPHDYTGQFLGPVSIRKALQGSLNVPAVKTLSLVGVDNAVQTMHDVGITSPLKNCGLSLVLGGCEVKLVDHVSGFATLAAGGVHRPETGILKIEDSSGQVLEQYQDQGQQVIDPEAVYLLTNVLTDTEARKYIFGNLSSRLELPDRPVAAKTGTTQNFHDGWTLGYTPSLATGVWAGNNDGELLRQGADGVIVAAPIWHDFMTQALAGTPVEAFPEPSGIQHIAVDPWSGKLPTAATPYTVNEVFADYSAPTDKDDVHVISGSGCYINLHSERPDNPSWEAPVQAWVAGHVGQIGCNSSGIPPTDQNQQNQQNPNQNPNQPQQPTGNPPNVSIVSPPNGSTLNTPFGVTAVAQPDTGNTITEMDLLIDGITSASATSGSHTFTITGPLTPGPHTFAIHVVDDKGNSADTSTTVNIK